MIRSVLNRVCGYSYSLIYKGFPLLCLGVCICIKIHTWTQIPGMCDIVRVCQSIMCMSRNANVGGVTV